MFWFTWKGKNSLRDFGVWINRLPDRVRPEERHELVEIPGRSGTLVMLEGEDVYSSYDAEMIIVMKNSVPVDPVVNWLRGSSDLVLSNDIGKARTARIVDEVRFERDGNNLLVATIPFLFEPFRHSVHPEQEDRVTLTGSSKNISNRGDVTSRPIVRITGSGSNVVTIGGTDISFTGISGTIVVDCGAEIITKNGSLWTAGTSAGDFWKIPTGISEIKQTKSMTISVDPEWRWF